MSIETPRIIRIIALVLVVLVQIAAERAWNTCKTAHILAAIAAILSLPDTTEDDKCDCLAKSRYIVMESDRTPLLQQ